MFFSLVVSDVHHCGDACDAQKVLDSFKDEKHSLESLLHRLLPLKNEMDELDQSIVEVKSAHTGVDRRRKSCRCS